MPAVLSFPRTYSYRSPLGALTQPIRLHGVVYEDVEADDTRGQAGPGIPDDPEPVVPDPHPPQPLEPADRPLHYPPDLPQPAPVGRPPLADVGPDPQPPEDPPGGLAVVPPVGVQLIREFLRPPRLPPDPREVHHDRDDLGVVAGVRTGRPDGQGDAPPVDQQGVLRPGFPAVHRARAGLLPAAEGPEDHPVHDHHVRVQLVRLPQQPQEVGVQPVPDPEFLPRP